MWQPGRDSNPSGRLQRPLNEAKVLKKMTVSELAELSGLSKAYISQVKNRKRPPSQKLLDAISEHIAPKKPQQDYLAQFLNSRRAMGVTQRTLDFYQEKLPKFTSNVDYTKATRKDIERYLNLIPPNKYGLGNRHSHFRAIKTFLRWLEEEHGFRNPMKGMTAPILGKPILPSLTREEVQTLLDKIDNIRDKAIISLFVESGLRLAELTRIQLNDIDWDDRVILVTCKGQKQDFAVFGEMTEEYLTNWLKQHSPNGNIWGIDYWGISTMLRRLEERTGLPCNPHTFRRTFACLLRKAGVDTMTIKDLGRWESLEMVQRYTRSVTFHDSLKLYKAPLS